MHKIREDTPRLAMSSEEYSHCKRHHDTDKVKGGVQGGLGRGRGGRGVSSNSRVLCGSGVRWGEDGGWRLC